MGKESNVVVDLTEKRFIGNYAPINVLGKDILH